MNTQAKVYHDIYSSDSSKQYPKVSLTGNFIYYLLIFFAALIFTQALRSTASNIFFGFIFFLPWVMLIYALTARAYLKVTVLSESATISKLEPYTYALRVINESVIPYPFIDARINLPQADAVRCRERDVRFAMSPLAVYDIKNTINFRFRGTYRIGVDCIYVYDFFRLFRVRVDIGANTDIAVLPRRLNLVNADTSAISDSARETKKDPHSYEKIEISDIRDYRTGDPLKSIHWKLSSKAEDFIVRDYDTGSSKHTYIFCDMSVHFPTVPPEKAEPAEKTRQKKKSDAKLYTDTPASAQTYEGREVNGSASRTVDENVRDSSQSDSALNSEAPSTRENRTKGRRAKRAVRGNVAESEDAGNVPSVDVHELAENRFYDDMNEYCADGVVELTVAAVLRELREGNECTLLWFDRRSNEGFYCTTLRTLEDFNIIYTLFATAPLAPASDNVTRLSLMVSDTQDAKQLFVTSGIDAESVRLLCSMPGVSEGNAGATEVILYNPVERFAHIAERTNYIEGCRVQLASRGLKLAEGRIEA